MKGKQGLLVFVSCMVLLTLGWRCGLNAKDNIGSVSNNPTVDEILNAPVPDGKEQMSKAKEGFVMKAIVEVIERGHYDPTKIDDAMAKKIFDDFMEKLDYGKQIFTQEDINTFNIAVPTIDNQFKEGSTKFFDEVIIKYADRKKEIQQYFNEIINEQFDFKADDEIQIDGKKIKYVANSAELKERWRKGVKYRMLMRFAELQEAQATKKDTVKNWVLMSREKMLDSAKVSVKKNMEMYFKNINKTTNADLFEQYVNSLANLEDPHSEFFTPRSKQSFDEQMSGTFFGIGATLQMKENYCTIMSIVTGSPCYKQGSIKVDDKIVKVGQGADEAVDVIGWDIGDIIKLIRGKKATEVRLHIKHATGVEEIVSLIRDEIKIDETFAKSAIIKYNGKDYGFISLPEFYADFGNMNGKRCSEDVQVEIEKLKAENVQGIIMDLRYNGGGSLSDVVEIAGYFLGRQPVVLVGSKDAKPKVLTPRVSEALWDGPLVLLTNFASASASEILAGAIQDYNRGIIVGGNTFGKGTVQRPIDLDEVFEKSEHAPLGSIKLTLQKFYRVSGKSTQRLGVKPDIQLPDLFMYSEGLEASKPSALPYDEVAQVDYLKYNNFNLSEVVKSFNNKISTDSYYKNVAGLSKKVKAMQEEQVYSLNEAKYIRKLKELTEFNKQLDLNKNAKDSINIFNLQSDMAKVKADSVSIKKNEDWLNFRNKDRQIKEAVMVLANIKQKKQF